MADANIIMIVMLGVMLLSILLGVHIALALGIVSFIGTFLLFGNLDIAFSQLGTASFEVLRDYVFATVPMFILMGELIARSGAAADLFKIIDRGLAKIPGRLTVATVVGNAVFAAVTGSSIASATTFSRIAYPQMLEFKYDRQYALGSIAGSACLGMLIPPSVLLIIWGLLMEMSIGQLFVAGIFPGLILAVFYMIYNIVAAIRNPEVAGEQHEEIVPEVTLSTYLGASGIVIIIALVLGGIWGGIFTATEASGVGALSALVLAVCRRVGWEGVKDTVVKAAKTSAPIMMILLAGAMYSRFLALGGVVTVIQDLLATVPGGVIGILIVMALIWLALGALLDSVSILLLTVPIFAPLAATLGVNELAFAIFGLLMIEAGLLTPPFGLLVYTVKTAVDDNDATLKDIFVGSVPYWVLILLVAVLVLFFPVLATGLV